VSGAKQAPSAKQKCTAGTSDKLPENAVPYRHVVRLSDLPTDFSVNTLLVLMTDYAGIAEEKG